MDYILFVRDHYGTFIFGLVAIALIGAIIYDYYKKRRIQIQPQGIIPPIGAYIQGNPFQQKAYLEEQLNDIERESKRIVDEENILEMTYQQQKQNLMLKKQNATMKYNIYKKNWDEINMQLGVREDPFKRLGEMR